MSDRNKQAGMNPAPIPDFQLPYTAYSYGGQNGRVNLASPPNTGVQSTVDSLPGFSYPTVAKNDFVGDMLRGNLIPNPVSIMFFSPQNVARIQSTIKQQVFTRSGPKQYIIDDQDLDELKIIMRALYLQYSKNNDYNVDGQVNDLNTMVVDWAVPRILSAIDAHLYYLNDISHMPVPLAQPMNMSGAGTRSLPYQPFM